MANVGTTDSLRREANGTRESVASSCDQRPEPGHRPTHAMTGDIVPRFREIPRDETDAEVIAASFSDPELFARIFERHHRTVYGNIARWIGIDRAEDLTSEVFIRAFDARTRYDPTYPSAKSWLLGIARNVQLNELRRTYAIRNHVIDAPDAEGAIEDFAGEIVETQHLRSILSDESLVSAIDGLNPDIRETFLMFAIDDMSYVDIATALDVPLGTVRSRLGRARKTIREQTVDLMQIDGVSTVIDAKENTDRD